VSLGELETLDWLARRYSQRPSSFVGIADPLEAYRFDKAAATAGVYAEISPTTRPAADIATFSPRRGIKGRVPIAKPTPEQDAELDRLFPETRILPETKVA
jgi:hypothetical protein